MPVKILLADKSITIQKVVEMLFSGRDYEIVCASDGETALNEATRVIPDVVLVDVDLPRIDGYSFASRLKQTPQLAQTPVILMMSRDDVYDDAKGKQAGILDNIAKPFESQELIGKVKKAIGGAAPRRSEAAHSIASQPAAPERPAPPAAPMAPPVAQAAPPKSKKAAPADIFDIISEAPSPADLRRPAASTEEETVYEVEPVVEEVEEPLAREVAKALPVGAKAVEEMRAGLGLNKETEAPQPGIADFGSHDATTWQVRGRPCRKLQALHLSNPRRLRSRARCCLRLKYAGWRKMPSQRWPGRCSPICRRFNRRRSPMMSFAPW